MELRGLIPDCVQTKDLDPGPEGDEWRDERPCNTYQRKPEDRVPSEGENDLGADVGGQNGDKAIHAEVLQKAACVFVRWAAKIGVPACSLNHFTQPTELALPKGESFAIPLSIGASPSHRAFFVSGGDGVLAPSVFLSDAVRSCGWGPPQRGIVRSLSNLRPGSLRSPGASNASLARGSHVPACVSPEDPPRSKPGLSIPWPRSLAEGDSSCAWLAAAGFPT